MQPERQEPEFGISGVNLSDFAVVEMKSGKKLAGLVVERFVAGRGFLSVGNAAGQIIYIPVSEVISIELISEEEAIHS